MTIRIALLAIAVASILPSAAAHAENPLLVGTVGLNDGFNISLSDASGNAVQHLDPGTYTIQVHDRSEIHNFHLFGPGVDEKTVVETADDFTWTVTLTDGLYKYHCDPHSTVMHGSFTVGNFVEPPPPTKLAGTVGPGRTISLRNGSGSRVSVLIGVSSVVLTVNDRSRTDNFHLSGHGVNKATGVGFRGRVTWKLTLAAGKYSYRSDRHKQLHGSFTVVSSASRA